MFLFADSCTQCQCPGEKYLKPTQQVAAQVSMLLCPLSPFLTHVTLVLFSKVFLFDACGFCAGCVSVMGVLQRRKQKAAKNKVWTRSKAETLMEALPQYQPLRYLFLHEKFL